MMQASDKPRFAQIMNGMADNFRDSITKDGIAMRFKMLQTFTIEQIEHAALEIMKRRKYTKMPPVAEFIEILKPLELNNEDKAMIEANKVIAHLRSNGAGTTPNTGDPITRQLMATRWPYYQWARRVLESELKWWVKEFCQAYKAYSNQEFNQIENKRFRSVSENILKSIE
jgi:hypothetical protein